MDLISRLLAYPYSLTLLVVAALAVALAAYVWRRRSAPGAVFFVLLMACAAEWSLASSLEMVLPGLEAKVLANQLAYFSVVFVGPLWLLFALDYSQCRKWITRGSVALLCLVPVATLALEVTNPWHGLVWPEITLASGAPGALPVYGHGPVWWIHAVYSYTLLFLGFVVLTVTAIRSSGRERFKALAILAGVITLWMGCLHYVVDLGPLAGANFTPVAMTVAGLLLAWLIFHKRLFDIVPVARETLIASLGDGVIAVDDEGVIAELNPAARKLLGLASESRGRPLRAVLQPWPELCEVCCRGETETPAEILLDGPGGARWLDIRSSRLATAGESRPGHLILLRDITELKRSEEALKRTCESLRAEMAERKLAEERISHSLREKEVLLKEIHHRVKNNMQIITSLLNLQSAYTSSESAAALRVSQSRIKSMALVHEVLYRSDDLSRVNYGEYVSSLTSYLACAYGCGPDVTISVCVSDITLDVDTAIPCGLIVNELVTNSLKYAFQGGRAGSVRVGLAREGGEYLLEVSDDGAGLPPGLDFRSSPALGLQLVNTLVGQIGGAIELDKSAGTAFRIRFRDTAAVGQTAVAGSCTTAAGHAALAGPGRWQP